MTDWRRDIHFTVRCKCGHDRNEHRHDLAASSPCYRGGCGCQVMRPDARIYFEHRQVTEPIEDAQ